MMSFYIHTICFIITMLMIDCVECLLPGGTWTKIGTIDGNAPYEYFGWSVAMSADGKSIAVGATRNEYYFSNANTGLVRVYSMDSMLSNWAQVGADINGKTLRDLFGDYVDMSADGQTIVVGSPYDDNINGDSDAGAARVYKFNPSTSNWVQVGNDINGVARNDHLGAYVAMTPDGRTIIIGAGQNDNINGIDSGLARVYTYDELLNNWKQVGNDIYGEAPGDFFGHSVAISADGTTVAVGAVYNDGNGKDSGHVRVFSLNSSHASWEQIGLDINGEAADDLSGWTVSLSVNGSILAISALYNDGNGYTSGQVRVYAFKAATGYWEQVGSDIDGKGMWAGLGASLSMSQDGTVLAIGASGRNPGYVSVYSIDVSTGTLQPVGLDIDGDLDNDYFGFSVSLSDDGSSVVIGAIYNEKSGYRAGRVYIYKYEQPATLSPTKSPTKAPTSSPTKSPTKSPTMSPTNAPTKSPTNSPTKSPTNAPTITPTNTPTKSPTNSPTRVPTSVPTRSPTASPVGIYINEFHYENKNADRNKFIEIIHPATNNLSNYKLVLYDGTSKKQYRKIDLGIRSSLIKRTIDEIDDTIGYTTVNVDDVVLFIFILQPGLQNGPDGIALVDPNDVVIEFISYEGVFIAKNGPAKDMVSIDVGVKEDDSQTINGSIQICSYLTWNVTKKATRGKRNVCSTLR